MPLCDMNIYKCDECGKEFGYAKYKLIVPDIVERNTNDGEYHFCSVECLYKFVEMQYRCRVIM